MMSAPTRTIAVCVAAIMLSTLAIGRAVAGQEKRLNATEAWVKLPSPGETQAMAFATVENPTSYAVYVVSAKADVAGKVELRDASLSGDARLKPVEFVTAPAYDSLYMGPTGAHLMLLDLKRPLEAGDAVAITLTTDSGATLQVRAIVKND